MHETLDCYAFGNHECVKLKVFKIPTSQKEDIKDYIKIIEDDEDYIFNIYSMATMPLLHGFLISKAHNCMSFVSKIVELANVPLSKPFYKYSIKDMDILLKDYLYKEDYFYKTKEETPHYMDHVSIFHNIGMFLSLNITLIRHLLTY